MKDDLISCELGNFTWENLDPPGIQKGWLLNSDIRAIIANGDFECLTIELDDSVIKTQGGISGIEINFNSQDTGFQLDYKSFPWYWDKETKIGGWISYADLVKKHFVEVESGLLSIKYYLKSHPYYNAFKTAMSSANWGELSIQYGIGIKYLPILNAYLRN